MPAILRSPRFYIILFLALLLALFFWLLRRAQTAPPDFIPVATCAVTPRVTAPTQPWRFQTDPADAGVAEEWFATNFDDSAWEESAPGIPWENHGHEGYDGVGWYRAEFAIPVNWPAAYISTVQVDDHARIWINGTEKPLANVIPLPAGDRVQISYRIEDEGGFGGIKQPVLVGESPAAVLSAGDAVRWLAAGNPVWPLPGWARDDYYAWTFTGVPRADNEALMSDQGAVAPWAEAPLVEYWLRTADGRLIPPQPSLSLTGETLPIPRATWEHDDAVFESTLFVPFDNGGVHWQLEVNNTAAAPIDAELLVVVRPLAVLPDQRPIHAAGFDGRGHLYLNGALFMSGATPPQGLGVAPLTELMTALSAGELPAAAAIDCLPAGNGAAVLRYPLSIAGGGTQSFAFAFPTAPDAPLPDPDLTAELLPQTVAAWQQEIGTPDIEIPDAFVMNAYKASLGYLLLALDEDGPHPGPLNHDALWVRDAAFIGETLISLGRQQLVLDYMPAILRWQEANGYMPAVIDEDGPWDKEEWDSQGQLIFLIAELYRFTGDEAQLAKWYPHARRSAEFLVALRAQTADNPPESRGILPPSESAEDLGPADWHHHWDNFWGVIGLENGAFIAAALGETEDAAWMQAEADALRDAIRSSVIATMGPEPAYIPNGPEDTTSSAMARGSANSLYPEEVFPREDPLIERSFNEYYERWIAPQGGGYQHIFGHWWPYGGMGLARDYLRLGRQDILHQILAWSLTNQTLPGTFAWAEQVNPFTRGFSGGDMPHAWAASSYITMVREMLLMRDGDQLELFAGVPGPWLSDGRSVALTAAPTAYGPVTAKTDGSLTLTENERWVGELTVTIADTAAPPGGYIWRLPQLPAAVDGPPGTSLDGEWLAIPASGGTLTLLFEE